MDTNRKLNEKLIKLWRNNEVRQNFLKAYKDWGVWLSTEELSLTYYRYQLPDGTAIIAMEHNHYTYMGYNKGYEWNTAVRYYTQAAGEPFSPDAKSISAVAELLKAEKIELQLSLINT